MVSSRSSPQRKQYQLAWVGCAAFFARLLAFGVAFAFAFPFFALPMSNFLLYGLEVITSEVADRVVFAFRTIFGRGDMRAGVTKHFALVVNTQS